jgi:hypothetical protein
MTSRSPEQLTRAIPSTGELVPASGLDTYAYEGEFVLIISFIIAVVMSLSVSRKLLLVQANA